MQDTMLEYSRAISVHYNLCLLGSSDSPTSASRVAESTGTCHHAQLIFVFLVEMGFCHLARLVSNSCPQAIRLPWPPKVLGLQERDMGFEGSSITEFVLSLPRFGSAPHQGGPTWRVKTESPSVKAGVQCAVASSVTQPGVQCVISAHCNLCPPGFKQFLCTSLPWFPQVSQAGFELLTSSSPPISASQSAEKMDLFKSIALGEEHNSKSQPADLWLKPTLNASEAEHYSRGNAFESKLRVPFSEMGFHYVTQAGLELLGSSDAPTSASQSVELQA
ncbi:hypothetical protein AAY473_008250 [Plecturocebus cupreus]